jgi:hypothetical protein
VDCSIPAWIEATLLNDKYEFTILDQVNSNHNNVTADRALPNQEKSKLRAGLPK